jgi:exopolysaccharide biosynthesis polyprenyl glycosylphosphotransferase
LAPNSGRVAKGIIGHNYGGSPAVVGTVDQLARIARAEFIDEIIVAPGEDRDLAERAVAEAVRNHLDVSIVPELFIDCPKSLRIQELGGMPLISVHEEPIPWLGLMLKRVMDVLVSSLLLLVLLPCLMVIAAAIKLNSRGPVLYAALRVGRKGRTFRCYKFRTMSADADRTKDLLRAHNQRLGPTFKIANDPRITPLGRILRRYSLDELPQFWNVLNGTMSLVGPRPHPVDDYQRYALEDRRRLDVSPGITGLWQVTARHDPSFRTNMALDLEYIENWSLRMDLSIALRTLPALFAGTGA